MNNIEEDENGVFNEINTTGTENLELIHSTSTCDYYVEYEFIPIYEYE